MMVERKTLLAASARAGKLGLDGLDRLTLAVDTTQTGMWLWEMQFNAGMWIDSV